MICVKGVGQEESQEGGGRRREGGRPGRGRPGQLGFRGPTIPPTKNVHRVTTLRWRGMSRPTDAVCLRRLQKSTHLRNVERRPSGGWNLNRKHYEHRKNLQTVAQNVAANGVIHGRLSQELAGLGASSHGGMWKGGRVEDGIQVENIMEKWAFGELHQAATTMTSTTPLPCRPVKTKEIESACRDGIHRPMLWPIFAPEYALS